MELVYQGKRYMRDTDQTVLDCLISNGETIPNSCRSGVCCSCMMRSSSPDVPPSAQVGLKDTLKSQGYFLACLCKPECDFEICDPDSALQTEAEVHQLDLLNDEVIRLRLRVIPSFSFKAGQYISLMRNDGLTRSYSIASLPESGYLELHVRVIPGGKMSGWIRHSLRVGDRLHVMGPSGHCHYVADKREQALLLAGTGTGLAPLYGILQDALRHGHSGPIWLFHGGRSPFSLYLQNELTNLSKEHPQFQFRPFVLSGGTEKIPEVPLEQYILKTVTHLKTSRIYLCGDPTLVNSLRKKLFLAGASNKEIYADAFLPSLS
jgi:CDP-4-dehydro-6-deoxyglucose reductase